MKQYITKLYANLVLLTAGVFPAVSFANPPDYLAGLGDKPTHDTSVQDLVSGMPAFSRTTVGVFASLAVIVGVFLFFLCLFQLRKKEEAGEAILGMVVGMLLCIALAGLGLFVGIAQLMATGG